MFLLRLWVIRLRDDSVIQDFSESRNINHLFVYVP